MNCKHIAGFKPVGPHCARLTSTWGVHYVRDVRPDNCEEA
jgi:hypothetical protein